MSLTGFSLGMNIFTLRLFRCLHENLCSKQPIFTYLGSLERSWPVDVSHQEKVQKNTILVMMGLIIRFSNRYLLLIVFSVNSNQFSEAEKSFSSLAKSIKQFEISSKPNNFKKKKAKPKPLTQLDNAIAKGF
jgi:hypothetical protein